jgi:hypothetical protein
VGEHQRRHPRKIAIANLISISTKLGNDLSDALAVPNQDGIREEAEAARLIHDLFQIARAEFSPIGEKQAPGDQIVTGFASVEL